MKKLLITLLFASFILPGFTQVEDIAKDVLNAYRNRNAENLKKYASGFFKYAISESYFEDKDVQADLKYVDNWNGEIKEIRYKTGDLMGTVVTLAACYYADNPDNENEIYVVVLSTTDKTNWVMFAGGLSTEIKPEFEKMSLTLEKSEAAAEAEVNNKVFTLEMADGEKLSEVSKEIIEKSVNKLDDDNFFMILSSGDDYMQAAFSDQGYILQYSEGGNQFEAEEYLNKDQTIKILMKYFKSENWKEGYNWIEPSF